MHEHKISSIRPAKVSKELATAAYDDFKRKAIDEAKKRAVLQRVDYDTFKNMVLTAHLAPITAPTRKITDRPTPCWNFSADGTLVRAQAGCQASMPSLSALEVPSNSSDFTRDWRRLGSADDKYRYLQLCGPATLRSIFRVEMSSEVLREVLSVLEACWLGHAGAAEEAEGGTGAALQEAAYVVQLLEALTAAGRFSLTVKLLGNSTKPVLGRLFAGLEDAAMAAASTPVEQAAPEMTATALQHPQSDEGSEPGAHGCTLDQVLALKRLYGA